MPARRPASSFPRALVAPLLAALLLAAGCGGNDEQEVRDTLDRFAKATADKDYQEICDELLAPELVDEVRRVGLPCEVAWEKGIGQVQKPALQVKSVKVEDDTATAQVRSTAANQAPSEDRVRLVKRDGEWRIAALASP